LGRPFFSHLSGISMKTFLLFLISLFLLAPGTGCGSGKPKGHNKDKDKPKPTAMLNR